VGDPIEIPEECDTVIMMVHEIGYDDSKKDHPVLNMTPILSIRGESGVPVLWIPLFLNSGILPYPLSINWE